MKRIVVRFAISFGIVAALLLVNALAAAVLPSRWDWTRDRDFSLAPETQQVLAGISQPLTVTVLVPRDARSAGERSFQQALPMLRELLALYRLALPTMKIIELDPAESTEGRLLQDRYADVTPPCVVIEYGTGDLVRHEVLQFRDLVVVRGRAGQVTAVDCLAEQSLTAVLARLTRGQQQTTVYVLTGHGELALDDVEPTSPRGMGLLAQQLARLNYELRPLDLQAEPRVPADADLLIIAGPSQTLSAGEVECLHNYLANGGRLLLLADFVRDPLSQSVVSTGLEDLLAEHGLQLGTDRVITRGFTGELEAASPALPTGGNHSLLRSLPLTPIMLFECGSVRALPSTSKRLQTEVTPLLVSHAFPRAWAEGDVDVRQTPQPGGAGDTNGPVAMAAAVERTVGAKTEPVIVVIGDAEFAANRTLSGSTGRAGFSLLSSSLHWLRGRSESMGDIAPRRHESLRLSIDPAALRGLTWKTSLFLCAIIVTAGTTVWTSRRNG